MIIHCELELNRGWIYDENDEIIGETNFVVSAAFAKKAFETLNSQNKFVTHYDDFEEFLESYEPETDGNAIYEMACTENEIIEELETNISNETDEI